MAKVKLQPPAWYDVPEHCPGCSYSLRGLTSPGHCPECRLPFDDQTLVMIGIPRTGGSTSLGRRLAWFLTIIAAGVWVQFFGLMFLQPMLHMAFGVAWIAGFILLLVTGKRKNSTTQPLIFAAGGFGLASDEQTDASQTLRPWSDVNAFQFERISGKWYRIRIGLSGKPNRRTHRTKLSKIKFDAGVSCTDDDAQRVRKTLQYYVDSDSMRSVTDA